MECLAGGGEAGTATNRRRRPAGSGGFGGEIDGLPGNSCLRCEAEEDEQGTGKLESSSAGRGRDGGAGGELGQGG